MFATATETGTATLTPRMGGQRIHVLGAELTIKLSAADTGGTLTVFEGRTEPRKGPPLHCHREMDEWWYIVEGDFKFEVDGQELYARAGDTVFAPRGSRHRFQNIGDTPGRTITTVSPGGIELFFAELERSVPRGTALDPSKMLPVFAKYGQELLGPPLEAGGLAQPGPRTPCQEEAAIRQIVLQLETAWNSYDSALAAAQFASDATQIHIYGGQLDGREAIEASYRWIFDTIYKDSRASFTLRDIRFVRPDVAIAFLEARVDYWEGGEPRRNDTRPTLLVSKEQDRWQIVAFQNTKISPLPAGAGD